MLILTTLAICAIVFVYSVVKSIQKLFSRSKKEVKTDNPYIEYHKMKFKNDKNYEEYLKWLSENGGDVPFDKVKTANESKFERSIKKII